MSDCTRIQSMLSDYIEDNLNTESSSMVKNHINECNACQSEWQNLRDVISTLQDQIQPRAGFWDELDNKLDAALNDSNALPLKSPQPRWLQRLNNWIQPFDHWAPITAALVLIVIATTLINTQEDQKLDLVSQQKRVLEMPYRTLALQSYETIKIGNDPANSGSVSSFMPTQSAINYFKVGKYFGALITALLTSNKNDTIRLQNAIINEFKDKASSSSSDYSVFLQSISDITPNDIDIDWLVKQRKSAFAQSNTANPQPGMFDLGAWIIGFQYQIAAKTIDIKSESENVDYLIKILQNHQNMSVVTNELHDIRKLLDKKTLEEDEYLSLKISLNNIDRLMSII